ncbi:hypothetical protein SDRG_04073 [Saprolegnia diclina VS20]|uniref:Uncharacterized protein n=1 Tax=Saprolegnia diclina (strain VS20) TaxID=1156394 RepID=T0QK10_SAPDV|nr:hypothetical protein SDRG_04073 [Saprolegnia diclina VS20]EQC38359.1 hypothetical protein SDRG_04073 [Saprolegnia diclina VS20]|eukprot:XP_008607951.1 hypothetical protein SDRG_04073 [Saprolegnia diclina VS20]
MAEHSNSDDNTFRATSTTAGRVAYCKTRKAWHALAQTRIGGGKRVSHYCPWRKDKEVALLDAATCIHIGIHTSGASRGRQHWRKALQLTKMSFEAWQTEPLLRGVASPHDLPPSAKVQLDCKYGGHKRDRNLIARVVTKQRQIDDLKLEVLQHESRIELLAEHLKANWYDGICLRQVDLEAIEHARGHADDVDQRT